MVRKTVILLAIVAIATLSGCSSEEPPRQAVPKKPAQARPAAPESAEDARLASLKERYGKLQSFAMDNPRERDVVLHQIQVFHDDAAGTEYADKAATLAESVRKAFDDDAERTYRDIVKKAEDLKKAGNWRGALEVLREFPDEFTATKWRVEIDKLAEPLDKEAEADSRMDILREEVKQLLEEHNPESALTLVNKYPKFMRTGEREKLWEELHKDLSARVKAIEDRRIKEDAIPWEDLFSKDAMGQCSAQSGEWELRDGVIVGKCPGGSHAFMACGGDADEWSNFILELDFKIVSGNMLVLGIRGKNVSGHSEFEQIEFNTGDYPSGSFHSLVIEARGKVITIRAKGSIEVQTKEADANYDKGFMGFFILPGAEVHIRKLRIKHLK
jgi:hypothetical protein